MSIQRTLKNSANRLLAPLGLQLARSEPFRHAYLDKNETVLAAKEKNLSVSAYVQELWGSGALVRETMERMQKLGALTSATQTICEIGAGTGQFVEETLRVVKPLRYEVYEANHGWAEFLSQNYPVVIQPCDGVSLAATPNNSVDLVTSHGVFVYTAFLTTMSYLREIARVLKVGGYAFVDVACQHCFSPTDVEHWLAGEQRYPAFLSCDFVQSHCESLGLKGRAEYMCGAGPGRTHYLLLEKTS